jgi:hypothetical protein
MKQVILQKLFEAEQLVLSKATVDGLTFDDAELNDASAEGCFEEIREKFSMLAQAVDYYID